MSDGKLNFETSIVCDDIRFEFNGKAILIGVYTSDIAVVRFPIQLGLAVFSMGQVVVPGTLAAPLRISDETGAVLFRSEDAMPVPTVEFKEGPFAMQSNGYMVVNKESTLIFSVVINGIEIELTRKRVIIGQPLKGLQR